MASIELDLHLESADRPGELAAILAMAEARDLDVTVTEETGPAGGASVVRFEGPAEEVSKIVRWAIREMNEDVSWADEYWIDR